MITCAGIMRISTAKATKEAGPSWKYSITMDPIILAGDEMTPKIFWNSI